jgi:uncharacterized protein YjbJ (UPF0337 family)
VDIKDSFHTNQRRIIMGELVDKTKGKLKQAVGDLTGNKKLRREGKADELKGKVEGMIDDAKDAVKDPK